MRFDLFLYVLKIFSVMERHKRVCNVCNCKTIQHEIHFLLDCPNCSSLRDIFFIKIEPSLPFPRLLAKKTLLLHIMNSTDYFMITKNH